MCLLTLNDFYNFNHKWGVNSSVSEMLSGCWSTMLRLRVSACLQLQNSLLVLLLAITVKLHPLEGFWSPSSMLAVLIWHDNLKCTIPWWDCNWPLEIEASSIRVKKTHPFCWCPLSPLHWLQPQISTLHQPQPSEGAVASSHFLGFLSVTPPSAYLLHQALDQGIDEHFAIMKL